MEHTQIRAGTDDRLRREARWQSVCQRALERFSLCHEMDEALGLLTDTLVHGLAADAVAVCLIQPNTGRVEVMRDIGNLAMPIQTLLAAGTGQAWYAAACDAARAWPVHQAPGYRAWASLFTTRGLHAVWLTPLMARGRGYGCVVCAWCTPPRANRITWLEVLTTGFAGHFWAMQEAMRADTTKLHSLAALGIALESRDGETFGHTQRVVRAMRRFMHAKGLEADLIESGTVGAYLHDIGKISVPDQILRKPGPLTPEEREFVQRHTVYGYEIARRLAYVDDPALSVIRHHHERWDGAGYPDGIAGDSIPLLARMFAIIDVYDALTHARPYKRAWPVAEARAYLASARGTQFDPELTDLYLALLQGSA
ncbi:MAG: HD-GYP domain-containing protein [Thermoflavifilum sp.]|nr:HD-GYP domain-containing protein [Thermoflavifilum sp.]MCL6512852.1 HD-GYP domain-containing protein [Alicyclobacillus sp.]